MGPYEREREAHHLHDGGDIPHHLDLRSPGNAGSNTAADHIEATRLELPRDLRQRVLIRADSDGGTGDFLRWIAAPGRRLAYAVGFTITDDIADAIPAIPAGGWTPAYNADRQVRPVRGSRRSPACSTCRPGPAGCGSSWEGAPARRIVLAQNVGASAKASVDAATEPPHGQRRARRQRCPDLQRERQARDRQIAINRTVGSSLRRSPGSDVTTCWLLRRAQITT